MPRLSFTRRLASILIAGLLAVVFTFFALTVVHAQNIALCAAPESALGNTYVTVNSDQFQVNVRSGPNSYHYGKIGILFTYESAPALGRSPGGDWIQISCSAIPGGSGWVYAANVTVTADGDLPVVNIPVTATPLMTATVDPALAAEFPPVQPTPTRLPTFTPAAPQTPPVFTDGPVTATGAGLDGSLIVLIAAAGLAVFLLSFFIRR